jgi:hypothetical protein
VRAHDVEVAPPHSVHTQQSSCRAAVPTLPTSPARHKPQGGGRGACVCVEPVTRGGVCTSISELSVLSTSVSSMAAVFSGGDSIASASSCLSRTFSVCNLALSCMMRAVRSQPSGARRDR